MAVTNCRNIAAEPVVVSRSDMDPFSRNGTAETTRNRGYSRAPRPKGVGFGLGGEVVVSAVAARLRKPDGTYGWDGAYGTYWWVNRKAQMVAVIFVQTPAGRCNTTSTMQFRKRSSSSESRWTRWFRPGAHHQPRLWEASDLGCQAHIRRGCPARVVDDVRDLAVGADANRDQVVEPDVGVVGSLKGAGQYDAFVPEDAIDAKSPGFVAGDIFGHLVRGPAVRAGCARVARLVRRIVGDLALVEVDPSTVAVPDYLELLVVFDK